MKRNWKEQDMDTNGLDMDKSYPCIFVLFYCPGKFPLLQELLFAAGSSCNAMWSPQNFSAGFFPGKPKLVLWSGMGFEPLVLVGWEEPTTPARDCDLPTLLDLRV